MAKGRLTAGGEDDGCSDAARFRPGYRLRAEVQRVLVGVLDGIVKLVHPIMPFVAESLWQALGEAAPERRPAESERLPPRAWSSLPGRSIRRPGGTPAMEKRMARMQELVRAVREIRNRYQVDPKIVLEVSVRCGPAVAADFTQLTPFIQMLAGVGRLTPAQTWPNRRNVPVTCTPSSRSMCPSGV